MKIPLSGAHPSSPASEKIWRHVGSFCPWSVSRRWFPVASAGDLFWRRSKTIFSYTFHISWENFGLWTIFMIFLNCFISRWGGWLESPGVKGFLDGNGRVRTTLQIGVIICWTCFSWWQPDHTYSEMFLHPLLRTIQPKITRSGENKNNGNILQRLVSLSLTLL